MRAYKSVKGAKTCPNTYVLKAIVFHRPCGHNRGILTPLRLYALKNKSKIVPAHQPHYNSAQTTKNRFFAVSVEHLVISVKEARKLLGKDGEELSDEQIEDLIIVLTEVGTQVIGQDGSKKTAGCIQ